MTPRLAMLWLLACFAIAQNGWAVEAVGHKPAPHKATADQLLADAENSVAVLAQLAQPKNRDSADLKLKLTDPRQKPFWSAVRKMEQLLKDTRAQLKAHEPAFFDSINETTQTMALLQGACIRAGISSPPALKAVKMLGNALMVLRMNYGREVRMTGRRALTLDEKQDFERLKTQEQTLLDNLKALRTVVDESGHLKSDIDRISARLRKVIDAPLTADAFRAALANVDVIEGEWEAMSYFVEPRFRDAWKAAGTAESFQQMDKVQGQATVAGAPTWDELDQPIEAAVETETETKLTQAEIDEYDDWLEETVTNLELAAYYDAVKEEYPELTPEEFLDELEFGDDPEREK